MIELNLYNGKEKITFDENRHIFYDGEGNKLLSVTAATGVIDKSGALMGWAVKMMGLYLLDQKLKGNKIITEGLINEAKREYRRLKTEAADIGTEIHEWVSDWILKKNPEMPDNEKVVNGIMAFLKFQKEHKFKWIESERYIFSKKYRYAGILDSIAKEGNKLILVDFKSSNGIYDSMRFQVSGYKIAWEEETGKKIDERMILRFGKNDGEFEIKRLDNDAKDKKAFLNCLNLKKRLKEL
jgi:hypothetical protein